MSGSKYGWIVDRAFMLEKGASFKILRKGGSYGGLFSGTTNPNLAVQRIRVKLHQYAQAARKKIRVRVEPDGETLLVYRSKK